MSTIRYSIVAMNWALDNVESAVDRHIAKNDAQKGSDRGKKKLLDTMTNNSGFKG